MKHPAPTEARPREGANGTEYRTLWRAEMLLNDGSKQEFLFRAADEFLPASAIAEKLIEGSPGANMANARLVQVAKVAHLWN